jgi:hypothetical protein
MPALHLARLRIFMYTATVNETRGVLRAIKALRPCRCIATGCLRRLRGCQRTCLRSPCLALERAWHAAAIHVRVSAVRARRPSAAGERGGCRRAGRSPDRVWRHDSRGCRARRPKHWPAGKHGRRGCSWAAGRGRGRLLVQARAVQLECGCDPAAAAALRASPVERAQARAAPARRAFLCGGAGAALPRPCAGSVQRIRPHAHKRRQRTASGRQECESGCMPCRVQAMASCCVRFAACASSQPGMRPAALMETQQRSDRAVRALQHPSLAQALAPRAAELAGDQPVLADLQRVAHPPERLHEQRCLSAVFCRSSCTRAGQG